VCLKQPNCVWEGTDTSGVCTAPCTSQFKCHSCFGAGAAYCDVRNGCDAAVRKLPKVANACPLRDIRNWIP
jgi:hypothetical protein